MRSLTRPTRLSRRFADETGSAAAEFAIAVPSVIGVLVLCVGALTAGSASVAASDAAADAARLIARGESQDRAGERVRQASPDATMEVARTEFVCVTVRIPTRVAGIAAGLDATGRSCALGDGA